MKTSTAVIVSSVVVIILVIGAYIGTTFFTTITEIQKENAEIQHENIFYENWYNSLEERRIQLENKITEYKNAGFWESLSFDTDYWNAKINELDA